MLVALMFAQVVAATPPTGSSSDAAVLMTRARAARYQQDSILARYVAVARQRMSAGIGLASMFGAPIPGHERLAARMESVARVGWDESRGAWGEIIGARSVVPMMGGTTPDWEDDVALVLPYYPGRDELWPMSEMREGMQDHRDWINHPLAAGSDSLYDFSLGDALRFTLPDRRTIQLREIRVRPRRPAETLVVGSLWVDVQSGSLVRAAYRPSTPVDLWKFLEPEIGSNDQDGVKRFGPFTGVVHDVILEMGLYEGRFWLPRVRTATAEGTALAGRISVTIEQTFTYESVAAMPAGQVAHPVAPTVDVDSAGRARYREWSRKLTNDGECRATGDSLDPALVPDSLVTSRRLRVIESQGITYRVLMPCDPTTLITSPALPKSIYGDHEELFPETDFARLRDDVAGALGLDRQAEWNPQPPVLFYGLDRGMLRYNRIEGLSPGVMVEQTMGKGYTRAEQLRIGAADLQPNGEVTFARSGATGQFQATAYRRLNAAGDWGNPFGVGASAVAALFGRDDGFYYRSYGAEITGASARVGGVAVSWRLFGERQDSAPMRTNRSLANTLAGTDFRPNIQAEAGTFAGAAAMLSRTWGADPRRLVTGLLIRTEAAGGAEAFGRGSFDLTLSRGSRTSARMDLSAGSSLGTLPPQRLWYLGGAQTVRGYPAGAAVGDAYWLGRLELSHGAPLVRPSVFADLGWAGRRSAFTSPGRPMSGMGVGASMLDGLFRLEIARSFDRAAHPRLELYFDPR